MYTRAFVKNLILPSISIGVVRAEGKEDDCDSTRKLIRPRDLPLYVDPPKCVTCSNTIDSEDGFLLTTVRCVRQELQSVLEQARVIQVEANSMLDNIKKETSDAVSYLQQEENLLPRMGAIGVGAFAGYILAARKGILKKILYSATGAGAIAAIAYPNEAREYAEEVMCELKKYAVIGYHFVNGADVDWKKLKDATRPPCYSKSGNSGEQSARRSGRSEVATQNRTKNNLVAENMAAGGSVQSAGGDELAAEDVSKSQTQGESNAADDSKAVGGLKATGESKASANCPAKKLSYRDQCRQKGSCGKKRSSDGSQLPKDCECKPRLPKMRSKAARSSGSDPQSPACSGPSPLGVNGAQRRNGNSNGFSANAPGQSSSNGSAWSDGSRRPYRPSGPAGCGPL